MNVETTVDVLRSLTYEQREAVLFAIWTTAEALFSMLLPEQLVGQAVEEFGHLAAEVLDETIA